MSVTRRRVVLIALGGAVMVVPVAAAARPSASSNTAPIAPAWLARDVAIVQNVQAAQSEHFAVFRRARTAADAVPPAAKAAVGDSRASGRNLALSRAIRTPTGRGLVSPGDGTICLSVPDPVDGYGVTCGETVQVVKKGLALMMISPERPDVAQVTLLLPDGATAENVARASRTTALRPDADGIVATEVATGGSITVDSASGSRTLTVPSLPADLR
jgi:hypothetical protein